MRSSYRIMFLSLAVGIIALMAANSAAAVDHRLFAELLQDHVKDGVVDYAEVLPNDFYDA